MNTSTNILIILVIIMSLLGTSSFILFFTNCPPSCNNINQKKTKEKFKKIQQPVKHTQLIPIEDIFNDF